MAFDGESPLVILERRSHRTNRAHASSRPQIFYLGYSLGQPTTLLWKLIPPRYFVTFLTLCWGSFALRACNEFVPVPSAQEAPDSLAGLCSASVRSMGRSHGPASLPRRRRDRCVFYVRHPVATSAWADRAAVT